MALTAQHWTISGLSTELKIDRRTLGEIIDEAKIEPSKTAGKKKIINYYRMADIVAAMTGSEKLDLQQEKALLAKEQRRRLKRENDTEDRKIISHEEVIDLLQQVSKQAATIFDGLPLNIKRKVPTLKAKDIEYLKLEIAKARNAFAKMKIRGPDPKGKGGRP